MTDPADDQDSRHRENELSTGTSPVASTIPSLHIVSVEETAPRRSKTRACCTRLLHQQPPKGSESSFGTTASADPDCYTNLLHQPSKRLSSPPLRSPHGRRANPPGLILRGRVFHVRVTVPRPERHENLMY